MNLTKEQSELAEYMSEISEDAYCAGWIAELEFDLWRIINSYPQNFGLLFISSSTIEELKSLSEKCNGWIYWSDNEGMCFMPLDEWQEYYSDSNNIF